MKNDIINRYIILNTKLLHKGFIYYCSYVFRHSFLAINMELVRVCSLCVNLFCGNFTYIINSIIKKNQIFKYLISVYTILNYVICHVQTSAINLSSNKIILFPPHCHHMSFCVTDFCGWDAHEAQLRCSDGVWVVIEEDVVPGGALNLNSTDLPRPWSPWESSPSRKIPTVESI